MTGGRRGFCNRAYAANVPVYDGFGYGRGLGLRRGFRCGYGPGMGRAYGRGYGGYRPAESWYPPAYPIDARSEIDMLKQQADHMKSALDAVNRRIDELGRQSSPSA